MQHDSDAGWSKDDLNSAIIEQSIRSTDDLIRGANGIAEGYQRILQEWNSLNLDLMAD